VPDLPIGASPFRQVVLPVGSLVWRTYQVRFGCNEFNPGRGDTRFAPVVTTGEGPIPTLYCGSDQVVVLLESVLHDIHQAVSDRIVYEAVLRNWGLVRVRLPRDILLVDLRNAALARNRIARKSLVATTADHYPCTRQWSLWLYETKHSDSYCDGIVWHSRQAEIHAPALEREVYMLFGGRAPSGRGDYPLAGPGVENLTEGPGRLLLERIAEQFDARIEPTDD